MAVVQDQSDLIAWLGTPGRLGHGSLDIIHTHGAVLFLTDDLVFKLKRAVRYPFLDYSSPAKRRWSCAQEVRLNQRTAPEIYLGIQPIHHDLAQGFSLGALDSHSPEAQDWLVVMRRFDCTLAEEGLSLQDAVLLAKQIAQFHDAQPPIHDVDGFEALASVQEDNLQDLAASVPELDEFAANCRSALKRLQDVLKARSQRGCVRHCHGDLHLANVCRWHGHPVLFDCIEFDPAIAQIDTFYDLAFLLMDLDVRGLRREANIVLNRYLECRPTEGEGLSVLPICQAIRAQVRAKVLYASLPFEERAVQETHRQEAQKYLSKAQSYLCEVKPQLIAVGGPSGSGKSTLSAALAPHVGNPPGAVVLRSDAIRKRLFGTGEEAETLPKQAYRVEASIQTYEEMERLAEIALAQGASVIADATFTHADSRVRIERLAQRLNAPFSGFFLELDQATAALRVDHRRGDVSDATREVVKNQYKADWGDVAWARLDATRSQVTLANEALSHLDP